jgi:hypothetical protein
MLIVIDKHARPLMGGHEERAERRATTGSEGLSSATTSAL